MRKFFELNRPYKFDPTDLTALIYVVSTIVGMTGGNTTPYFLIGSAIGTAFCWQAHRINLVVLNLTLFIFNLFCFFA
jgi:H+/Cl- antiporter ClcA